MAAELETDSIRMIRDAVGAIAPHGDLTRIRSLRNASRCLDEAVWKQAIELGLLSLRSEEHLGGLGLGARELCAIGEELGRGLVPEPVLVTAAIFPVLPATVQQNVLDGYVVLPAWQERHDDIEAEPSMTMIGGHVEGRKILIPSAASANSFLVTSTAGLALVERGAPGVELDLQRTRDGDQMGTLTLRQAPAECVPGAITGALEDIALSHCAYLLGASERAFTITLDYLGIRKQFGRYIGSFQVLQHRAVDVKLQLALSRAVLEEAINVVDGHAAQVDRRRVISRAAARTVDTAMLVARESVQMHGAIGITDEHDIGLYCRKILSVYNLYGSARWHRGRYLRLTDMGGLG